MKKKIKVFVSGVFNVLHPGHLRLLRFAREYGTELYVGVLSDKLAGNAAHVNEDLRLEGIKTNGWVSKATIINDSLVEETILPYSLSYDHRVIDGADAARFTTKFSEQLSKIKNIKTK